MLRHNGGKLHAFLTCLPTCGSRALKHRDPPSFLGDRATREKLTHLLPQDSTFKTLAMSAAESQVFSRDGQG